MAFCLTLERIAIIAVDACACLQVYTVESMEVQLWLPTKIEAFRLARLIQMSFE